MEGRGVEGHLGGSLEQVSPPTLAPKPNPWSQTSGSPWQTPPILVAGKAKQKSDNHRFDVEVRVGGMSRSGASSEREREGGRESEREREKVGVCEREGGRERKSKRERERESERASKPLGEVRGFRWDQNLGCHVTKFARHNALKLVA